MRWFSPGIPRFIRNQQEKIYESVRYKKNALLYLNVQMLDDLQRKDLAQKATEIYNSKLQVAIKPEQIYLLPLDYLKGTIKIVDESGQSLFFVGQAINLMVSPLKVKYVS
jgi:hypothetical protein